jgi:hypothetical protein
MQAVRPEEESGNRHSPTTMQAVRPEEESGNRHPPPMMQAGRPVGAPTRERR